MSSATMTMIGAYNYDNSIFDGLSLPDGIDKETCVNEILNRCGEFTLLYTNLDFLKNMITHFSNKHYRTFEKWIDALNEEFNPLHNYDRHEVYTDCHSSNETTDTVDKNKSTSISQTSTNSTNDTNRNVSAYDSSTMQPKESEKTTSSGNGNGLANNESDSTGSVNRFGNDIIKHEAHLYGNIGTTKSTEMLLDFLSAERWNIYEHIADIFCDEFCIAIY